MATHESRTFRAALFRISAASHKDLLTIAPSVARSLRDCNGLLRRSSNSGKDVGDASLLHKFRTQITTFLNAKSAEARWAGTILAKAAVELGGYEVLASCGAWSRAMLQNLNKPDPASSKKIIIITLTRIFDLTDQHQTLTRELTTPLLKDFIPACVSLVTSKANNSKSAAQEASQIAILPTVLDSFAHLLPMHPNIFRPHLSQLRRLVLSFVDPASAVDTSSTTQAAARRLFVLLPFSAPKPKAQSITVTNPSTTNDFDQWRAIVHSIHTTTSLVFRSIYEDWSPLPSCGIDLVRAPNDGDLTSTTYKDALGLPPWQGIHDGLSRLRSLLALLMQAINSPTPDQTSVPLATITDLVVRICSLVVPVETRSSKSKSEATRSSLRTNDQVSQTERDALLVGLPHIHTLAMELISALIARLNGSSKPLHDVFLDQIVWVFQREKFNHDLRAACYTALTRILRQSGTCFSKSTIQQLTLILNTCCEDMLASPTSLLSPNEKGTNGLTADSLTALAKPATSSSKPETSHIADPLTSAASELLVTALGSIMPTAFPNRLRTTLDRTAILTQKKDAMLASILNPPMPVSGSAAVPTSILPFLARAAPESLEAEALLRPRLPAIRPVDTTISEDLDSEMDEPVSEAAIGDAADGLDDDENMDEPPPVPTAVPPLTSFHQTTLVPDSHHMRPASPTAISTQALTPTSHPLLSGTKRPAPPSSEHESIASKHQSYKHARFDSRDSSGSEVKAEARPSPGASSSSSPAGEASTTKAGLGTAGDNSTIAPAQAQGYASYPRGDLESSDEEDFVIPEINVDPDTEDEDESDEDMEDGDEPAGQ